MRHRSAVIVGSGHFQLIHIDGCDLAFAVKQGGGIDFIEAVNRGIGIIAARAHARGGGQAEAEARSCLHIGESHTVLIGLADGRQNIAMAVLEAHGGGGGHIGKHGLFLIGEGVILGLVLFLVAAVLERASVEVGAVLLKPFLYLIHGLAHKELLELVHLLFPGAGAHHIIGAALPLGLPGGDLSGKVLLGVLGLAVYLGIVVGIQIVAALSREAAEMRHRSAVIVGGGYFQLVHIQGENASLGIKQRIGIDLVEAVNRGFSVIAARADTAGIHHTLSHIEIRCGNLLGFLLLFFAVLSGGGIGLGVQRIVHGVQNGFTGNGGAGNYIHIGGVGFHNLRRKLCGCLIADAGGFIGGIYLYIGDLVPFPGHSDSHGAAKALGCTGEGLGTGAASQTGEQCCHNQCGYNSFHTIALSFCGSVCGFSLCSVLTGTYQNFNKPSVPLSIMYAQFSPLL